MIEGFKSNDVRSVSSDSHRFLDIVKDLDMLLACHEGFLLGPWLQSAKSLARDLEQEKQVTSFFALAPFFSFSFQNLHVSVSPHSIVSDRRA